MTASSTRHIRRLVHRSSPAAVALAALGLPLANDMDGRPLVGCMRPDFLESHPVTAVQTYESGERRKKEHGSMDEMSEDLKEQLRSIGYIE